MPPAVRTPNTHLIFELARRAAFARELRRLATTPLSDDKKRLGRHYLGRILDRYNSVLDVPVQFERHLRLVNDDGFPDKPLDFMFVLCKESGCEYCAPSYDD